MTKPVLKSKNSNNAKLTKRRVFPKAPVDHNLPVTAQRDLYRQGISREICHFLSQGRTLREPLEFPYTVATLQRLSLENQETHLEYLDGSTGTLSELNVDDLSEILRALGVPFTNKWRYHLIRFRKYLLKRITGKFHRNCNLARPFLLPFTNVHLKALIADGNNPDWVWAQYADGETGSLGDINTDDLVELDSALGSPKEPDAE